MSKITTAIEAVKKIHDGDTIMVASFGAKGYPSILMEALTETTEAKNLILVSNGVRMNHLDALLVSGRAVGAITTFLKGSDKAGEMFNSGDGSIELLPQGSFAEKIRAAGVGIPAFYTPVGVGTFVAEGKEIKTFNGKEYVMETALKANAAFIKAAIVDEQGNCFLKGSTKNFAALMARAADYVVVEAENLVPVGTISPELVTVPGIFIDAIVKVGE